MKLQLRGPRWWQGRNLWSVITEEGTCVETFNNKENANLFIEAKEGHAPWEQQLKKAQDQVKGYRALLVILARQNGGTIKIEKREFDLFNYNTELWETSNIRNYIFTVRESSKKGNCPNCKGTGTCTMTLDRCPDCTGTGYLSNKK